MAIATFTLPDCGCIFDSNRGIYMGEAIQCMALTRDWTGELCSVDDEFYDDATEEAVDFLNTLCEESICFGYGIGAPDFMLMPVAWFSDECTEEDCLL